jgi:predicted patatin/cPLA2 family phospholipase
MRALSLPGCGCRGAFQFAVLARLVAAGERFDIVGGASSGSISGAAYVAGKSLDGPAIYRSFASTKVFSPRWLRSEKSPFGMSRIVREGLERFVPERDILGSDTELLVTTTALAPVVASLARRKPIAEKVAVVHSSRKRNDRHDVILASCTFPPFYSRLYRLDGSIHIDGGAADNTLLEPLIARGATHITIITPHPSGVIYPGLFRALEPPRVPPHVELRVIHPARPLRLKSFDFDAERLEEALTMPHRETIRAAS